MQSLVLRVTIALISLFLAACVQTSIPYAEREAVPALPAGQAGGTQGGSSVIEGVPFIPAEEHECGPAALAEAMRFWGARATKEEIARETLVPSLKGSLPFDLARAAERRGFNARMEYGSLDLLKAWVRSGRPAILELNYGTRLFPFGHYLLVYGYDDRRGVVFARSSKEEREAIPYDTLDRAWSKTGRWTLLIVPKEQTSHAPNP